MARLLILAALTVVSALAGFAINVRWLVPVLNAAPAFVFMVMTLRRNRRAAAIGLMVWWAFCLALTDISLTIAWRDRAESALINSTAYSEEMISWISTGVGRESTPSLFVPQHLLHAGAFCLLALASGGLVSLGMGAILMNYMSFYVGDLILRCSATTHLGTAVMLAWNPWSMVRVVSFIILGVTLAEPLLSRLKGEWPAAASRWRWLGLGAAGLGLDMMLKAWLAPHWPALLSGCLG